MPLLKVPIFLDPKQTNIKSNFTLKQNLFMLIPFAAKCLAKKGLYIYCIAKSDESIIILLFLLGFQIPVLDTRGLH
jgi:hypothetical protein